MMHRTLSVVLLFDFFAGLLAVSHSLDGKCACQSWKAVYKDGVTCGKGKEFADSAAAGTPLIYKMATNASRTKMCQNFFQLLDTRRCVNMNVGTDEGTWCYVDAACDHLVGGAKVSGTKYSWKRCEHQDAKLRDYTPEELYEFSKKNDLLFGGVHRMAYPGKRAGDGALLRAEDLLGQSDGPLSLGANLRKYSGTTSWFDLNAEGKLPTLIVKGTKVYKVSNSKNHDSAHPGTWTTLQCVRGCQ